MNVSSPEPPVKRSLPVPPSSVSLNGEPIRTSSPVSPFSVTAIRSGKTVGVPSPPSALASIRSFKPLPSTTRRSPSLRTCFVINTEASPTCTTRTSVIRSFTGSTALIVKLSAMPLPLTVIRSAALSGAMVTIGRFVRPFGLSSSWTSSNWPVGVTI